MPLKGVILFLVIMHFDFLPCNLLICLLIDCWIGHGNLIPVTPASSVASSQLPDDVLKFYEDSGVGDFAREVCIMIKIAVFAYRL